MCSLQGAGLFTRLSMANIAPLFHSTNSKLYSGGRRTQQAVKKLGALISAPIATATTPNLAAASKKGRNRRKGKLNHVKLVDYRDKRQNRIKVLKAQLEDGLSPKSSPVSLDLAPTVKASPPPFRTLAEAKDVRNQFQNEFFLEHEKLLDDTTRLRIHEDSLKVKQGGLSRIEERFFLQKAIEVIESTADRQRLQRVLEFWKSDDFEERLLEEIKWVSENTARQLSQTLKVPPEDFEPLGHRLENIFLSELPPFARRKFLSRKAELFYSVKGTWIANGTGPSMLPTLSNPSKLLGFPITEENVHKISVGNIVSCVLQAQPEGNARRVVKRIRAIQGETVEFKSKSVLVPQGHCWLVGDNEAQSYDSRHYGAVPLANIRSRWLVTLSFSWPFVKFLV